MLTFLLVWTVALGSLSIFLAGMIFPELSRKNDLIWVGVGMFYALILWAYSGKMGGGFLLGEIAGVSMMVWLGVQTMTGRRKLTPEDKKTPVPEWLQKIVDFVVPLWGKAYGAIAGQLGLETGAEVLEGTEDTGSDLKAKVLGFLDKLNNTPKTPGTPESIASEAEAEDLEEDWDEDDIEASEEPEAETQQNMEAAEAESEIEPSPTPEMTTAADAAVETAEGLTSEATEQADAAVEAAGEVGEAIANETQSEPETVIAEAGAESDTENTRPEPEGGVAEKNHDIPDSDTPAENEPMDVAETEPTGSANQGEESLSVTEEVTSDLEVSPQSENQAEMPVQEESNWPPEDESEQS